MTAASLQSAADLFAAAGVVRYISDWTMID